MMNESLVNSNDATSASASATTTAVGVTPESVVSLLLQLASTEQRLRSSEAATEQSQEAVRKLEARLKEAEQERQMAIAHAAAFKEQAQKAEEQARSWADAAAQAERKATKAVAKYDAQCSLITQEHEQSVVKMKTELVADLDVSQKVAQQRLGQMSEILANTIEEKSSAIDAMALETERQLEDLVRGLRVKYAEELQHLKVDAATRREKKQQEMVETAAAVAASRVAAMTGASGTVSPSASMAQLSHNLNLSGSTGMLLPAHTAQAQVEQPRGVSPVTDHSVGVSGHRPPLPTASVTSAAGAGSMHELREYLQGSSSVVSQQQQQAREERQRGHQRKERSSVLREQSGISGMSSVLLGPAQDDDLSSVGSEETDASTTEFMMRRRDGRNTGEGHRHPPRQGAADGQYQRGEDTTRTIATASSIRAPPNPPLQEDHHRHRTEGAASGEVIMDLELMEATRQELYRQLQEAQAAIASPDKPSRHRQSDRRREEGQSSHNAAEGRNSGVAEDTVAEEAEMARGLRSQMAASKQQHRDWSAGSEEMLEELRRYQRRARGSGGLHPHTAQPPHREQSHSTPAPETSARRDPQRQQKGPSSDPQSARRQDMRELPSGEQRHQGHVRGRSSRNGGREMTASVSESSRSTLPPDHDPVDVPEHHGHQRPSTARGSTPPRPFAAAFSVPFPTHASTVKQPIR